MLLRQKAGVIRDLSSFRSSFRCRLSREVVDKFWSLDSEALTDVELSSQRFNKESMSKIILAKKDLERFILPGITQLVAVSGSVASGHARADDDTDLFVVVKNSSAWIYRLYVKFRNIGAVKFRGSDHNGYCVNLIVERDATPFDADLFTLNEILHLVPIYEVNDTHQYFLNKNSWLHDKYGIDQGSKRASARNLSLVEYLLFIPNLISFAGQFLYMLTSRAGRGVGLNWKGMMSGKIENYSPKFKEHSLREFESINEKHST